MYTIVGERLYRSLANNQHFGRNLKEGKYLINYWLCKPSCCREERLSQIIWKVVKQCNHKNVMHPLSCASKLLTKCLQVWQNYSVFINDQGLLNTVTYFSVEVWKRESSTSGSVNIGPRLQSISQLNIKSCPLIWRVAIAFKKLTLYSTFLGNFI